MLPRCSIPRKALAEAKPQTADLVDKATAETPKSVKPPIHRELPGPTPKPIPWGVVKNMAAYFCPAKDICAGLELSYSQVNERCKAENGMTLGEFLQYGEGQGRNEIRRQQFLLLQRGNAAMAKWMGMQHLGQAPVVKISHRPDGDAPPPVDPDGFQIVEIGEEGEVVSEVIPALPAPESEASDAPASGTDNPNP